MIRRREAPSRSSSQSYSPWMRTVGRFSVPALVTWTPPPELIGAPKESTPPVTGNQGWRGISRWVGAGSVTATALTSIEAAVEA